MEREKMEREKREKRQRKNGERNDVRGRREKWRVKRFFAV